MMRRQLLRHAIVAGTALGFSRWPALGASVDWPIGCFNRPWTTWNFDDTLLQIRAAGYDTVGLLTRTRDEPLDDSIKAVRRQVEHADALALTYLLTFGGSCAG